MVAPTDNLHLQIECLTTDSEKWRRYEGMINKLVEQLSPGCDKVTWGDFYEITRQDNFALYIIRDAEKNPEGEFMGMATVFLRNMLTGWVGEIHDVVVDEKYWQKGYGRLLTKHIFGYVKHMAQKMNRPIKLCLTSRPERAAANAMYVKYGFELIAQAVVERDPTTGKEVVKGTNLYRKTIDP